MNKILIILKYRVKYFFKKKGFIAHHGIQRSGTNFLLLCLKKLNLDIINEYDPIIKSYIFKKRNFTGHKHFRWYANKEKIPKHIKAQYINQLNPKNIHELNLLCNYPKDTKHIVIQKDKNKHTVSILNWGLRCNWFSDKSEALKFVGDYREDFDEYYNFWSNLSEQDPDFVKIVDIENIQNSKNELLSALKLLKMDIKNESCNFFFEEVPQSPKKRTKSIKLEDILEL